MSNTPRDEWAEDFGGVWHRMSTEAWARGDGPTDPVACCGKRVYSVHHSTVDPVRLAELDGDVAIMCEAESRHE